MARVPLSLWEDGGIPGSFTFRGPAHTTQGACRALGAGVALGLGGLTPKLFPLPHKHLPGGGQIQVT